MSQTLTSIQRLQAQGIPCALVSVVRVVPPTSAHPGDKAVVTEDGRIDGWIGGGCTQPVVARVVRSAIADGIARVVRIAPSADGYERNADDVLEFGMTCHSGGTIELFVDPFLPRPRLVVVGHSPVAIALSGLAPRVGLDVFVVAPGADPAAFPDAARVVNTDDPTEVNADIPGGAVVVVATQGQRDLQGLHAAIAIDARSIFFVSSARKAEAMRASLAESGVDAGVVASIIAPAGIAIGAQTPEEIALSVLAAVIASRRDVSTSKAARSVPQTAAVASSSLAPTPMSHGGSCCSGGSAQHEPALQSAALEAAGHSAH
ncbi:XdhC family protein [Caballeronia sp. dw_19]|uniref:XdhC family protein n=1 Tax=Caballeronia sp. dw_19 TaxID=2719791 RepID=UPI001BD66B96